MTGQKYFCSQSRVAAICFAIAAVLLIAGSAMAQESVILKLTGASDGGNPIGGLIVDSSKNLYGTGSEGGSATFGTVFELSPPAAGGTWTETTLYSFTGEPDGWYPNGALVRDKNGNLYGDTWYGGSKNDGAVFEVSPPVVAGDPWTEKILYSFTGAPDGQTPYGSLVMDAAGNLYGTTDNGGACGWGTVFELSPPATSGGAWTEQVIYSFRYTCNNRTTNDGGHPNPGLAISSGGVLYGTTYVGGQPYMGTVFKLVPPAAGHTAWTEQVIYTFTGASDGSFPLYGVTLYKGNLYGVSGYGANSACNFGLPGCGAVFELSPPSIAGGTWTFSSLYSFTGGADGANPGSSLVFDKQGNLYTSSQDGGNAYAGTQCATIGCGAVIKLAPPVVVGGPWTETTLYSFNGRGDGGSNPSGPVIGESSRLYGITFAGGDGSCGYYGAIGCGVVYRIIP
jgi:uncharacterized repeat protein (TIGR03803 family)